MPKPYWEKRQQLTYLAGEKKINAYYKGLQKAFEQSKREIQGVINEFFMRYAKENILTYAEAQKQLGRMELGELQEFIDLVNEAMGTYNLKLVNMSIRARITRYQALEKQIDAILQRLYALEYEYKGKELLKEVYTDAYYRTWFNIDRYHGFHQEFAQINPRTIDALIKYPWNGADFSSRIWKQKDHMLQVLTEDITTMLVQGRNPQTLARDFAKRFNTKEYEAYRLLHTEGSFIIEQGTLAAYKEDGVEKYEIVATLDMKTSDICRSEDGKIYDIDKAVVGVNYPPYHPFCRTTTVPYYEDVEKEGTRAARDPKTGKTYYVPSNMKYKDWKKAFVNGASEDGLKETISKNVFVAAKDLKEAEAFATDMLGSKVSYKGMDLDTANSLNEGMFKTLNEFPQLKGFIDEFKVSKAKSFYGQFSTEMIRLAPDQIKIKKILKFSNMGHKENIMEKLLASIEKDVKKNFHFKGITPQHIVAHELTHALEHQIVFNRLNKDVLSISEWNNFARTLNTSKEAKSITDAALENMGINPVGREAYEAYKDLGRYALKNRSELMAQAVADALVSDEPLQFSLEVLKEVKKRLGGVN